MLIPFYRSNIITELPTIVKENLSYTLNPNSDEWKTVEFHLKSSIPTEVQINRIVSVKNILTYNQFEILSANNLWSYGWYNLKGSDYEFKMKEMREKTFHIPPIGVNFRVGAIFDQSNSSEVETAVTTSPGSKQIATSCKCIGTTKSSEEKVRY